MDTENEHIGPLLLTVKNYKKVRAISISFTGPGLTVVEGKNAQGKSSALDALLTLLLGAGAISEKPIREGEDSAEVELTLSNGRRIVRKFRRSEKDKKGYTSEILLLGSDGGKLGRPAETVAEWLGSDIAFDPLAFAGLDPKRRRDMLAKMLGIDLEAYDAREKKLRDERESHYRIYDAAKRKRETKPELPPKVERVDVTALNEELAAALAAREGISVCAGTVAKAKRSLEMCEGTMASKVEEIAAIHAEIERLQGKLAFINNGMADHQANIEKFKAEVAAAELDLETVTAAAPDIAAIQQRISDADGINREAQQYEQTVRDREKIDADWQAEQAVRSGYDAAINGIRDEKIAALAAAEYPVPNMGFGEDDVELNGLPFSQASQAEQIKAGIGVALAFNPKLQIVVTHDASLLDSDNLRLLHELAKERGCYVLGEKVADVPGEDDVFARVFVEDGAVKND